MDSYSGALNCYFDPLDCPQTAKLIFDSMITANTTVLGEYDPNCGPNSIAL
jgi:hypothetical protein